MKSGETLYSLLRKFQFPRGNIHQLTKNPSLSKKFILEVGQLYQEQKTSHGVQITLFERKTHGSHVFTKKRAGLSTYHFKKQKLRTEIHEGVGRIVGPLIINLQKVIPDRLLPLRFIDAFSLDFHLEKKVQRGARFLIRYEKKFIGDKFIRYGELLYAELEIGGKNHKRRFLPLPNGGIFISESPYHHRPLFSPVNYMHFSSRFQRRRFHPIRKKKIAHLGVDFAAPMGTPIYSAESGIVKKKGRNRAAGNYVVIEHKSGLTSYYNHLSKISEQITMGQTLPAGYYVGEIGCTGHCTQPHLHFAVKKKGQFIDPMKLLKNHSYHQKDSLEKELAKTRTQENNKAL